MSARELKAEVEETNNRVKQEHLENQEPSRNYLGDALPTESKQQMEEMTKGKRER
jgi:predicted RNA-binding protein with PIN domain